jgi:competence protein ComEC
MFLTHKVHKFYLNFAFLVAILLGFIVAAILRISFFAPIPWLILSLILLIFSFWKRQIFAFIFIIFAGFLLSFWRFSNFQIQKNNLAKFVGAEVEVRGILIEDADKNTETGEVSLKLAVQKIGEQEMAGKIWARTKTTKLVRRSDEVIVYGKMREGFGSFGGSISQAQIVKIMPKTEAVRDLRDSFASGIAKFITSPQLELGLGYLLGQKNSLPTDLETALRATALTHVVVASGYNLTVLVNFARRKFGKLSKRLAAFGAVVMVCGFVLVVGFSPSMTRAGIVALLGILFWYFGRRPNAYFLLIFVASLTLLVAPENLFDLGWQLSFGSFFGVMILAPLLKNFLFEEPQKLGTLASTFFETISAQIATLPLIVYTFGTFSTVSIFANMLVLPFVSLAMLLTFLTGIFAQILPALAQIFGWLAEIILGYSVGVIKFFGSQTGAQFEITLSVPQTLALYFGLVLLVIFLHFKTRPKREIETTV